MDQERSDEWIIILVSVGALLPFSLVTGRPLGSRETCASYLQRFSFWNKCMNKDKKLTRRWDSERELF